MNISRNRIIMNKMTQILATVLLVGFNSCGMNQSKCKAVKIGKFKLTSDVSGTTIIERTEQHQIERSEEGDYEAKYDLVWIDECNYELRNQKLIKGPKELEGNDNDVVKVEILEVGNETMKVRTTANFSDLEIVREIEIIE